MSNSILSEVERQSQNTTLDNFLCQNCSYYKGGLACENGVFIVFQGANMSGCRYYRHGTKCPHCGLFK